MNDIVSDVRVGERRCSCFMGLFAALALYQRLKC